MNDSLCSGAASIGDGRCSDLFQTDICVGESCNEIRQNGSDVWTGTARATEVFELAEVGLNTDVDRTGVQAEESSLAMDA